MLPINFHHFSWLESINATLKHQSQRSTLWTKIWNIIWKSARIFFLFLLKIKRSFFKMLYFCLKFEEYLETFKRASFLQWIEFIKLNFQALIFKVLRWIFCNIRTIITCFNLKLNTFIVLKRVCVRSKGVRHHT